MLCIRKLLLATLIAAASMPFEAAAEFRGDPLQIDMRKALIDPDKDYRRGIQRMLQKAREDIIYHSFLDAAERGHAQAQYFVALHLREGKGVEKNQTEALNWAKKSSDGGFLRAADLVGSMYMNGEGVEKSPETAIKWFEKSAQAGFPQSQMALALAYIAGNGTAKDPQKALEWGRKAADSGFPPAKGFVAAFEKHIPSISVEKGIVTRLLPRSVGYTDHLEKMHQRPMEDSEEIIGELLKEPTKLIPPYLYELARRLWPSDKSKAITWYLVGYMRAKFDAFKCKDVSARGGYRLLSALAPEVVKGLGRFPDLLIPAGTRALEIEEKFPTDTDPVWICRHGLDTITAGLNKTPILEYTTDPKTWPDMREKLTSGLLPGLQKIVDKQAAK